MEERLSFPVTQLGEAWTHSLQSSTDRCASWQSKEPLHQNEQEGIMKIFWIFAVLLAVVLCFETGHTQDRGESGQDPATILQNIQKAIDEKGAKWTAGVNDIFLLSPEEKQRLCGALDTVSLEQISEAEQVMRYAWHPEKFDWRNKDTGNWMTPVKNQGGCGSCVAFATIGTLEGQLNIYHNDPNLDMDLSEAHIYFCGGRKCDEGWWVGEAYKYIVNNGAADEDCLPYTAGNGIDQKCSDACPDLKDRTYTISCWGTVEGGGVNTPAQIKEYLLNGPVTTTMTVFEDFNTYDGGIYEHVWGEARGGHAIVFVGWDDTTDPPCWIVRNSWGRWGEGGYFRIRMGTNDSGIESKGFYMMLGDVAEGDVSDNGHLYGRVEVGTSRDWILNITNVGVADLEIYGFSVDPDSAFTVTPPTDYPQTIVSGDTLWYKVSFVPRTEGFQYTRLSVFSNSCRQLPKLKVRGTGIIHRVKVHPTSFKETMDEGQLKTVSFSVVNEADAIRTFSIEVLRDWLSVEPDSGTIESGGSRDFVVTFDASSLEPGEHITNILIWTDDSTDKVVVVPIRLNIMEASGVAVTLPKVTIHGNQAFEIGIGIDNNTRMNTPITTVSLQIGFNPNVLNLQGAYPTTRTDHMSIFQWSESDPGILTLSISDNNGNTISPGTEDVAEFTLQIQDGASCGDSLTLNIQAVTLIDTTGVSLKTRSSDGLVITLCKGDVDASGTIDIRDVLEAVQYILQKTCDEEWNMDCWAADYNDDGKLDVVDLIGMINVILGQ